MGQFNAGRADTAEVTLLRVFLEDSEIERRAFCIKDKISLGRDPYADVRLEDPTVSRLHVVIERARSGLVLHDKSSNGTWVNGRRVKTCAVGHGEVISAGCFTLLVEVHPDSRESKYDEARAEGLESDDERTIAWVRGSPRRSPWQTP